MKIEAKKTEYMIATAEVTSARHARVLLNKLTPDNYKRLKGQILEQFILLKENRSEQVEFSKIFFKKAALEENYQDLYAQLIDFLSWKYEVKVNGISN